MKDNNNPIQESIEDLLLPTLFDQTEPLPNGLRQFVTLTPAQGRLGVPGLQFEAPQQFAASTSITAPHVDSITTYIQHVHGGRREFHGRVKKTTSSLENCVGEIENGKY